MSSEEFYKEQNVKALYDMPAGIVALKEKDLFKLMEDYALHCQVESVVVTMIDNKVLEKD
jgi:hypothetical protein